METKGKVEIFGKRLKKVVEGINTMKTFGLSEEILVAWLCHKLKISEKKSKQIINATNDFYEELVAESSLERL